MSTTLTARKSLISWPEWLPRGKPATRTVLLAMTVVSLPFLWQGGIPYVPMMMVLAWWRLRADSREWQVPSVLTRALLVAPVVVIVSLTSGFGLGRPTGMLLAAIWLKLVEMRRDHDYHVQVQFCLLLITAQMLAAIDPFSTFYATCSFLLCLVCLQRTADPAAATQPWMATVRHSLMVLAKAAPVAVVLFVLAPRGGVQIGLQTDQARSGISDTLQPGSIARLAEDDSRAFTVAFEGDERPSRSEWYWRGPTLWRVDERHRWYGSQPTPVPRERIAQAVAPEARRWRQQIMLEPHHQHWVFTLDHPVESGRDLRFYAGHGLAAKRQVDSRLGFTAVSAEGDTPNAFPMAQQYCLDLPPNLDPRIHELARSLRGHTPRRTALNIKRWFATEGFRYTRSPGTMGADPTAEFLFEVKEGFCSHYASAFTILARAAGHPARIIVGYKGGTWNPYGEFIDVRQRNAHAWCEVYWDQRGWMRFDPTDDADGGSSAAGADVGMLEDGTGFFDSNAGGLFGTISQIYDFIDQAWFRFVYSYDESMQRALLALLGLSGWALLLAAPLMLGAAALLVWLAVRYWPRGREGRDPVSASWHAFCRLTARKGCSREAHEGPMDFAHRAAARFPTAADQIHSFATAYTAARYGRPEHAPSARELNRLRKAVRF